MTPQSTPESTPESTSLFGNINQGEAQNKTAQQAQPEIPAAASNEKNEKNVFSLIQEQTGQQSGDANVMNTIIHQKEVGKETGSVLDTAALKKLSGFTPSTTLKEEQYLTLGKIILIMVLIVSLGTHLFFYTQLSPTFGLFGANVFQKWSGAKQKAMTSHNELVERKLILAQTRLDGLLGLAQNYGEDKQASTKTQIIETFKELKNFINIDRYPTDAIALFGSESETDTAYTENFVSNIDGEINDLKAKLTEDNISGDQIKERKITIQLLETVKKLYQRKPIRTAILAIDLESANFAEELNNLVKQVNELSQTNFSIIRQIQEKRIEWDPIIKKITKITQQIDPNHASKRFKNLSTIEYSSFALAGDKLTISGTLKTKDSKNFSQIADLIDLFEQDEQFMDVSAQSFAKSHEPENKVYISALQIELTLQNGSEVRDAKETLETTKIPVP